MDRVKKPPNLRFLLSLLFVWLSSTLRSLVSDASARRSTAENRHFEFRLAVSVTFQEDKQPRKNEYLHVKCPSTQNIYQQFRSRTRLFIFLYFLFSFLSTNLALSFIQKLLMSLFRKASNFDGFSIKKSSKFSDTFFLPFFQA